MRSRVNRRIFLRGLGGACVAAPFLGSLGHRAVKAQAASAPRRFIAMFTHYGCITNRFFPIRSHGSLIAEDLAPTTLKHLTPFISKLLIPRGIRGMNEWSTDVSRGQPNDQHTQVCGSYFTLHPVAPNGTDPFSFDTATKFNAKPIGPSLDHVMAAQLSPGREPLLIHVGNKADTPQSAVSYSAPETLYPGIGLPSELYARLTGLFMNDAPVSPDTYQAMRGKSVIDLVRADLDTLERFDMSQADRNKLEAWKALLDDTGGVLASAACNPSTAAALSATGDLADAVRTVDGDVLCTKVTSTLDGADIYSNLAALAVVCNANPVIVLKYPPYYTFTGLGLDVESHALSHRVSSAAMVGGCVLGAIDMIATIDDYYARKFAHLVGLLDSVEEGDGTVLDNTAAVWFNEMSDGYAHNLNNLPIVQVGGAGGYFRTGCAVNVEDGSTNLSGGHSEEGCAEGASTTSVTSTGTDLALANAPINKYYCNLMNALGVKAGADGFPAVGGAAEVTHFGMYDRTEDFVGGGTVTPVIHSPGEYDALKA